MRYAAMFAVLLLGTTGVLAAEFKVTESEHGATVELDGELFTNYVIDEGPKPFLWPIIGPTGEPITRAYPMKRVKDERKDHPHHRSLWFTHGDVNGIDFWSESGRNGLIKHREFVTLEGGSTAKIVTINDWTDREGKKICEDERTLRFAVDGDTRIIDFDVVVRATDGPVTFGDTKEGAFGIRIPTSLDVESRPGGTIVNSEGQTDRDTWGQPARWVDYHGPLNDKHVGIAILNHPSSFRYPNPWHVRTYGLFAANPFGLHDFQGSDDVNGAHTIESGETMTLRYRVLLHPGDEQQAGVEEAFKDYAAEK